MMNVSIKFEVMSINRFHGNNQKQKDRQKKIQKDGQTRLFLHPDSPPVALLEADKELWALVQYKNVILPL